MQNKRNPAHRIVSYLTMLLMLISGIIPSFTSVYAETLPQIRYTIFGDTDFLIGNGIITGFSDSGIGKINENKNIMIDTETATEIADAAFENISIDNLVIQDPLIKIGDRAFKNTGLQTLEITGHDTVTGTHAFSDNKLKSVKLSGISEIGSFAFLNNLLTDITSDSAVIKTGAFDGNPVKTLTLTNPLAKLEENVFVKNSKVTVTSPDNKLKSQDPATYLVNPKEITISFKENGTDIKAPETVTKEQAELPFAYNVPEIQGYTNPAQNVTIDQNGIVLNYAKIQVTTTTTQTTATQPVTTVPVTTQAPATQPQATAPVTTVPVTTVPVTTTKPATTTRPQTTQPVTTAPAVTTPATTVPATTQPQTTAPYTTTKPTATTAPVTTTKAQEMQRALAADPEFVITGGVLTAWNKPAGFGGTVVIPAGVTEIAPHVFQQKNISAVTLNAGLVKIGDYAFADNAISAITLPDSLTEIGINAFDKNNITAINSKNVKTIKAGAFQNNRIANLTLNEGLVTLGDRAFSGNNLVSVTIPVSLTAIGNDPFSFNNRYVRILGSNTVIKSDKADVTGGFGHVVDSVIVTVNYINKNTGQPIITPAILGQDLTKDSELFFKNTENTYTAPAISGFIPVVSSVKFTPKENTHTLNVYYLPSDTKPTINIPAIRVDPNATLTKEMLLAGVKAYDLTGKEITKNITVDFSSVNTATPGAQPVTYTVTDDYGNTTVIKSSVLVGTDWKYYEIGNGWVVGDFVFDDATGTVVTLNEQGKAKYEAGNTILYLPPVNLKGDPVIGTADSEMGTTEEMFKSFGLFQLTELHIPEGYKRIGNASFYGYKGISLKNLKLPSTLETIGDWAFGQNVQNETLIIPDSVKTIGYGAFAYTELNHLILGNNVTDIGDKAFQGALKEKQNISPSLSIPDSVITIGEDAFAQSRIGYLTLGHNLQTIKKGAFRGQYGNGIYGNLVIPDSVTYIGPEAFMDNPGIFSLTLPKNLTTIEESTFESLYYLQSLTIPDSVTIIKEFAFANSNNITSVVIPDKVTSIETAAFANNGRLVSVQLPDSLLNIGQSAFENTNLNSIHIPDSVINIGVRAFAETPLTDIYIGDSVKTIGAMAFVYYDNLSLKTQATMYLGRSVITIGEQAFRGRGLTELDLPDTVTSIGRESFRHNNIKSLKISSNMDTIPIMAFSDNKNLEQLVIPDNIKTIDHSAFSDTNISTLDLGSVIHIGSGAFWRDSDDTNPLETLIIPDTVTEIGESAFRTNGIKSLTIGESVTNIGSFAFFGNKLTNLNIPDSVNTIGTHAFSRNNLTDVIMSNSVQTIDRNAFEANQISNLKLSESLENIGSNAFAYNNLTSVVIPDSVKEIGLSAFRYNFIKDLEMSKSIQKIGNDAFTSNLIETVVIPETITQADLSSTAFGNSGSVTSNNFKYPRIITKVYTDTGRNPNGLKNGAYYIVNPTVLTIKYVDTTDGKELFPTQVIETSGQATYDLNYIPYVPGYNPPQPVKITLAGTEMTYEVKYTKRTPAQTSELQQNTTNMKFRHYLNEPDKKSYYIGHDMLSIVALDLSGFATTLNNGTIELYYDSNVFNPSAIKVVSTPSIKTVNTSVPGVITLTLNPTNAGTSFNIPIVWAFRKYVTPSDTPYPISAIIKENGTIIAETDAITFTGYYNKPTFHKTAENSQNGAIIVTDTATDSTITYNEKLTYNFSITSLERNLSGYTITDTLPVYDTATGTKRTAFFDPAENPDWILSADKTKVTYTAKVDNKASISPVPKLILHTEGVKQYADIVNTANIEMIPYGKTANEQTLKGTATTRNFYKEVIIPKGQLYYFSKNITEPRRDINQAYFYDAAIDRSLEFPWTILYRHNIVPQKEIKITDTDLDEKLYYSAVTVKEDMNGGIITAYAADGKVLYQGAAVTGKFNFADSYNRLIAKVEVYKADMNFLNKTSTITIHTRLRNPENQVYDTTPGSTKNTMYNKAQIEFTDYEGTKRTVSAQDTLKILQLNQTMRALKTTTYPSTTLTPKNANGTPTTGNYTIGYDYTSEIFPDVIKDFEMIDILPVGLELLGVDPTADFKSLSTGSFRIEENYNNSGQTAIIFTALENPFPKMTVATIRTRVSETVKTGTLQNDLFVRGSNPEFSYYNSRTDARIGSAVYAAASVSRTAANSEELISRKYIKTANSTFWSDTGIVTKSGEKFEYRLSTINNTKDNITNFDVFDLLPFAGDTALVENSEGIRVSRGSEFNNTFDYTKGITVPAGYTVRYFNGTRPALNGKLDTIVDSLNWSATPSASTVAFRVTANAGTVMAPNTQLDIIVPMTAPTDPTLALAGKKAYNTFTRKNNGISYIEPNRVYNEMESPTGAITLTKEGYDAAYQRIKLAGAVFELRTADGQFISQMPTNNAGFLSFAGIPINTGYTVTEIKAPAGHILDSTPITVTQESLYNATNHTVSLGTITNNRMLIPLEPIKGSIKLKKTGGQGTPLSGVKFNVKGTEGKANAYVDEIMTTNSEGIAQMVDLPAGKYTVTELPFGNLQPVAPLTAEFRLNGSIVDLGTIVNDKANITLTKIGVIYGFNSPIGQIRSSDGIKLSGAAFDLYEGTSRINSYTTDATGSVKIPDLKTGTVYTLKETTPPAGYKVIYPEVKFSVNEQGVLLDEKGNTLLTSDLIVPNMKEDSTSILNITKVDNNTAKALPGAVFRLSKQSTTGVFEPVSEKTTDKDGIASWDKLTFGIYEVEEIKAPGGYVKSNRKETFSVDRYTANKYEYQFANIPVQLRLRKVEYLGRNLDQATADSILAANPGAELVPKGLTTPVFDVIKPIPDVTFSITENGNTILSATSDAKGFVNVDPTLLDTTINYKINEINTPAGYMNNPAGWNLNLKDYAMSSGFDGGIQIYMENMPLKGRLMVSKYDILSMSYMQGVKFNLLDSNKNVLKTMITNGNGYVEFNDLAIGTYYLQELETNAGYELPVDMWPIEITTSNLNISKTIYNKLRTLPIVGSPMTLAVTILAVAGLLGAVALRRKKSLKTNPQNTLK